MHLSPAQQEAGREQEVSGSSTPHSPTPGDPSLGQPLFSQSLIIASSPLTSSHQQLESQLQTYTDFVRRVFPGVEIEHLVSKDTFELAQIASANTASPSLPPPQPRPRGSDGPSALGGQASDDSADSGADESAPDREWNESTAWSPGLLASDDNNTVNLATNQRRRASFLGITSNSAVLRAIFRLNPAAKLHLTAQAATWAGAPSAAASSSMGAAGPGSGLSRPLPSPDHGGFDHVRERRCIKFYFEHVHAITPFLVEEQVMANVQSGRQDPSWLGLLYMILSLGSIASGSLDLHEHYYRRARSFLSFETLGMGNIESLQSLCLLGGYYLHFRNSPNMAFAVLGAAHRVAIALGLHRESRRPGSTSSPVEASLHFGRAEAHRRTWWSLFCFDTWMSVALGRPTCGRWDPTTMDTQLPGPLSSDGHDGEALRASCAFCLICNRIQHRFAQIHSHITSREALAFDGELQAWYRNLPAILTPGSDTPHRLSLAVELMRQRYMNCRLIVLRSVLVRIRSRAPQDVLSGDDHAVVEACTSATVEAIESIALYWFPNRLHVWTTAWHLFQACMAPLLCITISRSVMPLHPDGTATWERSVSKALEIFSEMRPWMKPTDHTPDIIKALFEALTKEIDPAAGKTPVPADALTIDQDVNLMDWLDDPLALGVESDWGVGYIESPSMPPNATFRTV